MTPGIPRSPRSPSSRVLPSPPPVLLPPPRDTGLSLLQIQSERHLTVGERCSVPTHFRLLGWEWHVPSPSWSPGRHLQGLRFWLFSLTVFSLTPSSLASVTIFPLSMSREAVSVSLLPTSLGGPSADISNNVTLASPYSSQLHPILAPHPGFPSPALSQKTQGTQRQSWAPSHDSESA